MILAKKIIPFFGGDNRRISHRWNDVFWNPNDPFIGAPKKVHVQTGPTLLLLIPWIHDLSPNLGMIAVFLGATVDGNKKSQSQTTTWDGAKTRGK